MNRAAVSRGVTMPEKKKREMERVERGIWNKPETIAHEYTGIEEGKKKEVEKKESSSSRKLSFSARELGNKIYNTNPIEKHSENKTKRGRAMEVKAHKKK